MTATTRSTPQHWLCSLCELILCDGCVELQPLTYMDGFHGAGQLSQWEVHTYQYDQIPLWCSQTLVVFAVF